MSENRDTPGFAQQSLPARATEIGHVRVVDRESKEPAVGDSHSTLAVAMACKSTAVHCYIVEKHVLAKKLNRWCDIIVILSATYIPKKRITGQEFIICRLVYILHIYKMYIPPQCAK